MDTRLKVENSFQKTTKKNFFFLKQKVKKKHFESKINMKTFIYHQFTKKILLSFFYRQLFNYSKYPKSSDVSYEKANILIDF